MSTAAPTAPTGTFGDHVAESHLAASASSGTAKKVELLPAVRPSGGSVRTAASGASSPAATRPSRSSRTSMAGILYFRNAADTSRYLSVSDGYHYVGFYNWIGATGWVLNGNVLTSLYTNAQLSYWSTDNGLPLRQQWLHALDGGLPLTVAFH